jgi:DNA-binding transcriptional LysR family regulator
MSAVQASPRNSGAPPRLNIGAEELETFLAIAELGSFSKAAERLFLAQPSISNRVQRLERAVSARLFERTTRAVVLTPAGERLRLRVAPIINDLHAVLDEFRTEGENRKRVVAVAATPMLAAMLLPPIIQRFIKANPAIRIELHDDVTPQLASDIRSQRIDFAVMARGTPFGGISFEPVASSRFMVVGPHGHPALARGTVSAAELSRHPFLALSGYHKKLEALTAALDGRELTLASVGTVSKVSTLLGFVTAGLGLTVLPSIVLSVGGIIDDARFDIAHLRGVSLIREYGIASLSGQEWSPAAKAFAAALRADFQEKSRLEDVAAD